LRFAFISEIVKGWIMQAKAMGHEAAA